MFHLNPSPINCPDYLEKLSPEKNVKFVAFAPLIIVKHIGKSVMLLLSVVGQI